MGKDMTQSSLLRGLQILETIVQAERPLSSAYVAESLDLPKATVHRIAQQLEIEGFLQREPEGKRFTASQRLKRLAIHTLSNSSINAHRHAILKHLSQQVNETCNLTTLDGTHIIYLDRIETDWPYRIHLPIGSRLPLHCTATGKLFLAGMRRTQRQKIIHNTPLTAHTPLSMTEPAVLEEQLQRINKRGFSYDRGEYLEDMIAIAVPVRNPKRQICFAIAIHAPSSRRSLEDLYQYLPELRNAADSIAQAEWD